jgi:hypothetical protein
MRALPAQQTMVVHRATWLGDTKRLDRGTNATFSELVGTDVDFDEFKRLSGAAAIQRAIEQLQAPESSG